MIRRILSGLIVFALLFVLVTPFVSAATTGTVTATVTAQNVAITVTSGTVTYGTVALGASKDTTATGLNDTQTATNGGNIAEDFTIKGTNSASWTLSGTAGSESYKHEFSTNAGTLWTALTTNDQSLASNVAASGTQQFDLKITIPTSTAATSSQSVNVTVTASTH